MFRHACYDVSHIVRREWHRDEITLQTQRGMVDEQGELLGSFHAFRGDIESETAAEPDDGAGNGERAARAVDAGDEAAIELHAGERQLLE